MNETLLELLEEKMKTWKESLVTKKNARKASISRKKNRAEQDPTICVMIPDRNDDLNGWRMESREKIKFVPFYITRNLLVMRKENLIRCSRFSPMNHVKKLENSEEIVEKLILYEPNFNHYLHPERHNIQKEQATLYCQSEERNFHRIPDIFNLAGNEELDSAEENLESEELETDALGEELIASEAEFLLETEAEAELETDALGEDASNAMEHELMNIDIDNITEEALLELPYNVQTMVELKREKKLQENRLKQMKLKFRVRKISCNETEKLSESFVCRFDTHRFPLKKKNMVEKESPCQTWFQSMGGIEYNRFEFSFVGFYGKSSWKNKHHMCDQMMKYGFTLPCASKAYVEDIFKLLQRNVREEHIAIIIFDFLNLEFILPKLSVGSRSEERIKLKEKEAKKEAKRLKREKKLEEKKRKKEERTRNRKRKRKGKPGKSRKKRKKQKVKQEVPEIKVKMEDSNNEVKKEEFDQLLFELTKPEEYPTGNLEVNVPGVKSWLSGRYQRIELKYLGGLEISYEKIGTSRLSNGELISCFLYKYKDHWAFGMDLTSGNRWARSDADTEEPTERQNWFVCHDRKWKAANIQIKSINEVKLEIDEI